MPTISNTRINANNSILAKIKNLPAVIATLVMVATIAAYAGLIPLGQWQGDEYVHFSMFRDYGIDHVFSRISTWSPRPISELLIYGYATLIEVTGRQLIAPFLSLLWLVFLGVACAPLFRLSGKRSFGWQELLLVLSLAALFMSGQRVAEVFYWAQGAAAYLPTLAAITFLTVTAAFAQRDDGKSKLLASTMLMIAALSSEVGAFFVLAYCVAMIGFLTFSNLMWQSVSRWDFIGCLLPLVAALWVVRMLSTGRVGNPDEIYGDAEIAHHLLPSLVATLSRLPAELLSLDGTPGRIRTALMGPVSKGAFALGCFLVFANQPRRSNVLQSFMLASLMMASAAAIFISLFGAYHQFGVACCERHETFRKCLSLLFIVAAVRLLTLHLPLRWVRADAKGMAAAVAMTASVLVANLYAYPRLAFEYSRYGMTLTAAERTWESGRAAGDRMTFYVPPTGMVNSAMAWPKGHFVQSRPEAPARYVLGYFGKQEGDFVDIEGQP